MRERLAKHEKADKRLRAALMEMLERDSLPLPDRAMDFQEEDWIKYDWYDADIIIDLVCSAYH